MQWGTYFFGLGIAYYIVTVLPILDPMILGTICLILAVGCFLGNK